MRRAFILDLFPFSVMQSVSGSGGLSAPAPQRGESIGSGPSFDRAYNYGGVHSGGLPVSHTMKSNQVSTPSTDPQILVVPIMPL
jgi:hypothetical protein